MDEQDTDEYMASAATHADMRAVVSELSGGFREVQRAILGDERLGHDGLVKRTRILEALAEAAPAKHREIEDKATDADKRIHGRIDALEDDLTGHMSRVEKKVDRLIWMAFGAGISGLALGGGGAWAILSAAPPG